MHFLCYQIDAEARTTQQLAPLRRLYLFLGIVCTQATVLIVSNGKARPKWRHCTLYSYEKGVMGTRPKKKKTALDISKRFDRANCFHSCSMY